MPGKKAPKGASPKTKRKIVSENIAEEKRKHPNMSNAQAAAIAYSEAGLSKDKPKKKPKKK